VAAVPAKVNSDANRNDDPPAIALPGRNPRRRLKTSVVTPPVTSAIMHANMGAPANRLNDVELNPRTRSRYVGIHVR
jgi:hypothetical protein